jgi:beta-glucosidase
MSGNKSLLTDVLKRRMGFDGFVVGDWNSHGQVAGCSNENCPQAINAGLDMFMYSGPDWKKLYQNTLAEARSGEIPAARLDDAVRRILRAKLRAGLFERGRPSTRAVAGHFELIGAPAHRAIARQAVRESMVLLKNEGVLPLKPSANILVAGGGADSISQQSGGWTITWQGTDVANSVFPMARRSGAALPRPSVPPAARRHCRPTAVSRPGPMLRSSCSASSLMPSFAAIAPIWNIAPTTNRIWRCSSG